MADRRGRGSRKSPDPRIGACRRLANDRIKAVVSGGLGLAPAAGENRYSRMPSTAECCHQTSDSDRPSALAGSARSASSCACSRPSDCGVAPRGKGKSAPTSTRLMLVGSSAMRSRARGLSLSSRDAYLAPPGACPPMRGLEGRRPSGTGDVHPSPTGARASQEPRARRAPLAAHCRAGDPLPC